MATVRIGNLYKTYTVNAHTEVRALNGVDLEIEEGDLVAVIGTSGSGKSTLLHIMAGIDANYEGEYQFDGMDMKSATEKKRAEIRNNRIGVVLQNFGLLADMTVFDNIALPLYLGREKHSKKEIRERVEIVLGEVGLSEKINVKAGQLSGGQKQRVAIARALINNAKLILADEPTGALDRKTSMEIMELFIELNKKGHTIVIVTHDMAIAEKCNRIVEISDGRVEKSIE